MILFAALAIFLLDRITKTVVLNGMSYGQSIKVLPNIFHITFVLNNGTAFGLLKDRNAHLVPLSFLAIAFIIFFVMKHKPKSAALNLALGLILGGAAGNLYDRISFGHIVDFLDFRVWPVFNIADSAITVGGIILAITILARSSKLEARSSKVKRTDASNPL